MSDRESGDDQPQGQSKYHGQSGGLEAGGGSDFDSALGNGLTSAGDMATIDVLGAGGTNSEVDGLDSSAGQQQQGEQELATKMLQIQSKRFYLDVKQNRRGRFIKVAEIGADGRRSQIFLALSTAAEFRDHLSTFSDFYASLGPPNPDNVPEDGKLKSEMMIKDNRRYYLDLKENSRGRFLRVSVSQTITRGGPRSQIAIPAQGMIEFRDALTDLLEEFGTDDGGFKGELPEGRHMRVENKNFYFDIGQNNRGIYMRISEKHMHNTAVDSHVDISIFFVMLSCCRAAGFARWTDEANSEHYKFRHTCGTCRLKHSKQEACFSLDMVGSYRVFASQVQGGADIYFVFL